MKKKLISKSPAMCKQIALSKMQMVTNCIFEILAVANLFSLLQSHHLLSMWPHPGNTETNPVTLPH